MDDRRRIDLVAFDVDGTLIVHPEDKTVWELLNLRFTGDDGMNRERLEAYRAGRLSYADWVALDLEGWRAAGARRSDLIASFGGLTVVKGVRSALEGLRARGIRLVVISGTLDLLLDTLLPDHPFDEVYCNRIRFDDGERIASWEATPFDMEGKSAALRRIARRHRLSLERCAFVGDSSNDVWIAREAGFTVAFNPKSRELESLADAIVRSDDLRAILPHLL